jgi:Putative peptidoglycan binding domain
MSTVRNMIKIVYPFIIIAVFFFVMSNFKHTETVSLAEEKSIKKAYNDLHSNVPVANVDEEKAANEAPINMLGQELIVSEDIRLGAKGENVRLVQKSLGLNEDGVFGPGTEQAVKKFQQQSGYEPDGIVGPQTWKALKENVESLGKTASINNDDSLAKKSW